MLSCHEDIYCNDHWDDLASCPWWFGFSPNLGHQMQWRCEAIANTGEDSFRRPLRDVRVQSHHTRHYAAAGPAVLRHGS